MAVIHRLPLQAQLFSFHTPITWGGRGGNKREMEGLRPLKATTRALQEGLSSPGFTSLGF